MQGEEQRGEGTDPRHGELLVGLSLRHQGREVAEGCGLPAPGGAHPSPSPQVREQRSGRPGQTTSSGLFVGRRGADRGARGDCTVGAAAWLCSLCRGLRARDRHAQLACRPDLHSQDRTQRPHSWGLGVRVQASGASGHRGRHSIPRTLSGVIPAGWEHLCPDDSEGLEGDSND